MEDGQHGRSGQNLQKHVETTVELQSGLGNALTQNQLLVEPTAKDSVLKQEWTNFPNVVSSNYEKSTFKYFLWN